ncbi:hypothetical protein NESM_000269700 [Novymonas esmeraldas]|uniref:RRM domain-containing protein n=1 Tax=Novymonas esmeraldas TaxID=1808958 RepID=A0AAW0F7P9_9TRYP
MQQPPLVVHLGHANGVIVCHTTTLTPEKLCAALDTFGKVSVVHIFVLIDGNYATAVFFADPVSSAACYVSLSRLAQEAEGRGILDVGWIHENSVDSFVQRPYVKEKHAAAGPSVTTTAAAAEASGYLVIYWKGVADGDREAVSQMARSSASEVLEDGNEGGRLFLRFASEDAADEFHSHAISRFSAIRRSVSYADATDFKLAKKAAEGSF